MSKSSIALNQNNNGLSNRADSKESHFNKFVLATNNLLAVTIVEGKCNDCDIRLLLNKKAFVYVLKNDFAPVVAREIVDKLYNWEDELTDLFFEIEYNYDFYSDYYTHEREMAERETFNSNYKYYLEDVYYPTQKHKQLKQTINILEDLNAELADCFEVA